MHRRSTGQRSDTEMTPTSEHTSRIPGNRNSCGLALRPFGFQNLMVRTSEASSGLARRTERRRRAERCGS